METLVQEILDVMQEIFPDAILLRLVLMTADKKHRSLNGPDGEALRQTKTGMHLLSPDLLVTQEIALNFRLLLIERLRASRGDRPVEGQNSWEDAVDLAVYIGSGLRMYKSRKAADCLDCQGGRKASVDNCLRCDGVGKTDEGRVYRIVYAAR